MGTVAATEDGIYTGRLVGELLHGKAKAAAVRALAAREGLDLRRCTAYSDSVNDVRNDGPELLEPRPEALKLL